MSHARGGHRVRAWQTSGSQPFASFGRGGRLTALLSALFIGLGGVPSRATAQSDSGAGLSSAALDSVRVALGSPDWNERHIALRRVNVAYADALPGAIVPHIMNLLAREAGEIARHEEDEEFGEYLVDLVLTAVRTGDPRVVPGLLTVGGLGISSGVSSFVASQGRAVMPALDSLAGTREDRASDVAETYALMYARYGSRLSRPDSARVLQRLLAAATHASPAVRAHVAYVAGRGLIVELLPLAADFATSDPGRIDGVYVARDDAREALPALQRARAAMPTAELLNRLALLTDAACGAADPRTVASCTALRANVADAARLAGAGQRTLAVKALDAYSRTALRLATGGLVPRTTAVTLDGTARAVIARLVA